ncbi:unnamed protein product [Absidia cylindrospora]
MTSNSSTQVDLESFRLQQSSLVCPSSSRTGTIKFANTNHDMRQPKFECTNSECQTTSLTRKQVNHAMLKKPVKRPAPSSTADSQVYPQEQQPHPDTLAAAPATPATFEHRTALPAFMTSILTQMNERREEQHELQLLKAAINDKDKVIQQQQREIVELRNQSLFIRATNGSSASKHAPQGTWANEERLQLLHTTFAEGPPSIALKKQQSAARQFSPPSASPGFQHVYLPTRARLRISQIRKNLKQLSIDTSRILDINYPARNTTSLLIHNDFVDACVSRLTKAGIKPLDSFDPTDPQHLCDPKYDEERSEIAFSLHQQRMLRSIDFIRTPAKYAVAKSFARTSSLVS